jgi:biopolymer transport protein TolQ
MNKSFTHKALLSFLVLFVPAADLAWAASNAAKVGVKAGILDGILKAGPVVQLLLLIMISMSVVSWAIIFVKWRQYQSLKIANAQFSNRFWKATSLESIFSSIHEFSGSSLARIFRAAFLELQRISESGLAGEKNHEGIPTRLSGIDNLERTIRKSIDSELAHYESRLNFLATTGSTAPFVGLLGTVIGIMTSFSHIAASGSASLAVVAPGISEALFATAIGLFAALPAVAAYNYFISEVRRIEMDLNSFGSDFLNIAKRNFFKDE